MNVKGFSLFLFFVLYTTKFLTAQDCLENLLSANKLLNIGNARGCITLAAPCSNKTNEDRVRWQAFRLMSLAYLLNGDMDSARIAAESMLDINPKYKPNLRKDPTEFINLVKQVIIIPKFTLGMAFSLGSNITFPKITQGYVAGYYRKTYTSKASYQICTQLGYYLNPKLEFNLGLSLVSKKFQIDYKIDGHDINIEERLSYLDIPITVKYILNSSKKLRFFVQGGAYWGYLLFAENDFIFRQENEANNFTLLKLNSIDRMKKVNLGLTTGLGAFYRIGKGDLNLNVNYFHSFSNITNPAKRYNYNELIYTYYFVDDDIRLHYLAISIGYSRFINYRVFRTSHYKK